MTKKLNHLLLSFILYHHAKNHAGGGPSCSCNIADLRTSKIYLAENFFDHAQLKTYKEAFTFLKSISSRQKLC